jgi:2-oxo-3-hexenedioate decarboxylase
LTFDTRAAASEVFRLWRSGRQIEPFSARRPSPTLEDAYATALLIRRMREAAGERPIGRKLAFTNRTLWQRYNVKAPGWGYVYDTTCHDLSEFAARAFSLAGFQEPRIEPEIVIGLESAPQPGMSQQQMLQCIGWMAHGFEIVHSVFPGWRFAGPDPIIGFGLHAALFIGPRHQIGTFGWREALASFEVTLAREGTRVAAGKGRDVLGSPLAALCDFNDSLGPEETRPTLAAGEFVSTGTITDAFPVRAGETWSTAFTGLPLPGATLSFS